MDMGSTAPFPWFGGKRPVAAEAWKRFGNVPNYVEPFAGSLAVLLARPHEPKTETVNDKCGFVANFWRAVRSRPEAVAFHADHPVSEADLEARHYWLVTEGRARLAALLGDPEGFDAQLAGWWCWGLCAWIGSGWCSGKGPWRWTDHGSGTPRWSSTHLGDAGMGLNRQLPHLGDAGMGVNRQLPHLGNAGMGVNRKRPHLGNAGRGLFILDWMQALAHRLRDVRVCCGEWDRVLGPSITVRHGTTAVLLDPPYGTDAGRVDGLYATDDPAVASAAREWALANGDDPALRIALCGYDGEHSMPASWSVHRWKAKGGYGSQGDDSGRANAARETIWFSPHCLGGSLQRQHGLFAEVAA